jgi:hypothetical protein
LIYDLEERNFDLNASITHVALSCSSEELRCK